MTEHGKASGPTDDSLNGFFREVTLSTGISVKIRKLDMVAFRSSAYRHVLEHSVARLGAENAREGGDLLASASVTPQRPAELDPELENARLMLEMDDYETRKTLEMGLVRPKLPELIALYDGDLELPDCGLGPDYSLLIQLIQAHSGVAERKLINPVQEVAEKRFPEDDGDPVGRDGQAVRKNARRAPRKSA